MNIIIDAMGGDNAPLEIVKGALSAHARFGCTLCHERRHRIGRGDFAIVAAHRFGTRFELAQHFVEQHAHGRAASDIHERRIAREQASPRMQVLGIAGLHDKAHASTGNAHHRHRNARRKALHIRNVVCARFAVEQVHNGGIGAAQIQIDKRELPR